MKNSDVILRYSFPQFCIIRFFISCRCVDERCIIKYQIEVSEERIRRITQIATKDDKKRYPDQEDVKNYTCRDNIPRIKCTEDYRGIKRMEGWIVIMKISQRGIVSRIDCILEWKDRNNDSSNSFVRIPKNDEKCLKIAFSYILESVYRY